MILVTDRRCTDERWVRDLLVDGCLTYEDHYWCMCSTDLCNSGDFASIRGMSINEIVGILIFISYQVMMIVRMIPVHRVLYVWIPKMVLVVYVHHGKMIAPMVDQTRKFSSIEFDSSVALNVGCSCKNGGRCIMGLGSYICECPYGYNGLSCETRKFDNERG